MAVVRPALHGGEAPAVSDFRVLLASARRQAVDRLLCGLPSLEVSEDDRPLFVRWAAGTGAFEAKSLWMEEKVASLGRLMDRHGIRYAVMKGQTCAHYYPRPLLRATGDIDVYVPPKDYDKALAALHASGLKLKERTMLHDTFALGRLVVELHFAINKLQWPASDRRLRELTAEQFDNADEKTDHFLPIGGRDIRTLPHELNIILLTAHALQHVICGGLGLRQIIDWQLVLAATAAEIDFPALIAHLKELGLLRMFLVLGYVNVHYLGMRAELFTAHGLCLDTPLCKRLAERLLNWTARCGNFGHDMGLGKDFLHLLQYYGWFFVNLQRFLLLSPREMLAWPWTKLLRGLTGRSHRRAPAV